MPDGAPGGLNTAFADGGISGSGGGGAGRIRINTTAGAATVTGTISPTLATSCATQGTLAR